MSNIFKEKICSVEGCSSQIRCKDVCNKHYHHIKNQRKAKPCACGCGELTAYKFKHGHHTRLFSSQEQSRRGRMNSGNKLRDTGEGKGYRKVGQRHEHRVIAEQNIGRRLLSSEIVHHINGNKRDNRPENLEVMTQSEHMKRHLPEMLGARKHGT